MSEKTRGEWSKRYGYAHDLVSDPPEADPAMSGGGPIQLETDVVKRIEHFRGLKKDWDSYGAEPIPTDVVNLALRLVHQLDSTPHEITGAFPTNDEGIQLDTESGMGIEVSRWR